MNQSIIGKTGRKRCGKKRCTSKKDYCSPERIHKEWHEERGCAPRARRMQDMSYNCPIPRAEGYLGSIPPQQGHRLIDSMPHRIDAVIHAKGALIKCTFKNYSEVRHFCIHFFFFEFMVKLYFLR